MAANIKALTDSDFRSEVLEAKEPVLVDFTATWCPPCKAIAPALDELAGEYRGRLKVTELNVDENIHTAEQFGIRSLPTLLFFRNGKVVEQIVGAVPKAKLAEKFQAVVGRQ